MNSTLPPLTPPNLNPEPRCKVVDSLALIHGAVGFEAAYEAQGAFATGGAVMIITELLKARPIFSP